MLWGHEWGKLDGFGAGFLANQPGLAEPRCCSLGGSPPSEPLALPNLAPGSNGAWARAGLGARAPAGVDNLNPAPQR
jgi:hypothetical protein